MMEDEKEGDAEIKSYRTSAQYRVWHDSRETAESIVKERFRDEVLPNWFDGSVETNNPHRMYGPSMDTILWTFRISAEVDYYER